MPFSTFLKSSKRLSRHFGYTEKEVVTTSNGSTTMEKDRTKRSLLRRLLKKSDVDHSTNQNGKDAKPQISYSLDRNVVSPIPNADTPKSPMADPNKPLPPPPPEDTDKVELPLYNPTLKLDRIIKPIGTEDLQKLFAGAPHFYARTEGHSVPGPSVAFPYDVPTKEAPLVDYVNIVDEAWRCSSAQSSHITALGVETEPQDKRFIPRCWERPSILSMQGLEKGTMGFQAALELGVADALQNPEDIYETERVDRYRSKALRSKEGIRPLTDPALIERLLNVSERYESGSSSLETPIIQLYAELFTHLLHPPSRVVDADNPYSLLVQVDALISVLNAEHIWFDFSKVEWRIRLGQLLWTGSSDNLDSVEVNGEVLNEATTQKYWLLLQILLSCELLFRLDLVTASATSEDDTSKAEEIRHYEKSASPSLRWSLLLSRQWLENIRLQKPTKEPMEEDKTNGGWLSNLTGAAQAKTKNSIQESISELHFEGRHQARQVKGLVHFARKLHWPNTDAILAKVAANGIVMADLEIDSSTPLATPRSVSTQKSSYFSKRPGLRRGLSSINGRLSAIINPSGWLSNSYVSGLILPGESLSHFLISTLLENDSEAVAKLGEEANLYGGFIYGSKSFWSISCIVGRVLAGGRKSRECMGWISSDIVPRGVGEQWVDIDVEPSEDLYPEKKEKRPRILRKTTVEQRGNIIAGADESSVLPGDFTSPDDSRLEESLSVKLQSLDFFSIDDTTPTTPIDDSDNPALATLSDGQIKVYSAMVRFSIETTDEPMREVNLSLQNDIYFLTAHPCSPPRSAGQLFTSHDNVQNSGHPLHKAFTYTKITLAHLLTIPISATFSSLLSPAISPTAAHFSSKHTTSSGIPKVLVIDCTSSEDLQGDDVTAVSPSNVGSDVEILGRALCSERGWNALVSRKRRGCLSCAIREAGAVGWRVILRVG